MANTIHALFGRYSITHSGHLNCFNTALNNGNTIIGIADSSRNLRSGLNRLGDIRDLLDGTYDTLLCNNMYQFLAILCEEHDHVVFYLGADRFAKSASLQKAFANLTIVCIERPEGAASSTALRNLFAANPESFAQQAIETGLVLNEAHAALAINAILDELND